ncbi:MAG: hypothetical protein ACRDE2_16760 [Chitinophagaceae bacterium]
MKKVFLLAIAAGCFAFVANAQTIASARVPAASKAAFAKAHPNVKHIAWETENGNFEGNWKAGGLDHSAMYTPDGKFAGSETDINPAKLPLKVREYMVKHYHVRVKEASVNEDANHVKSYEADANGKAYLFDMQGNFLKVGEDD